MKVYISGGISNDFNYMEKFKKAEDKLTAMGHIALNPCWIKAGLSYEQHMHIDLAMVDVADALYMLKDWEDSKGAKIERQHGLKNGKKIYYEGAI
jgi:hypothetical protein